MLKRWRVRGRFVFMSAIKDIFRNLVATAPSIVAGCSLASMSDRRLGIVVLRLADGLAEGAKYTNIAAVLAAVTSGRPVSVSVAIGNQSVLDVHARGLNRREMFSSLERVLLDRPRSAPEGTNITDHGGALVRFALRVHKGRFAELDPGCVGRALRPLVLAAEGRITYVETLYLGVCLVEAYMRCAADGKDVAVTTTGLALGDAKLPSMEVRYGIRSSATATARSY